MPVRALALSALDENAASRTLAETGDANKLVMANKAISFFMTPPPYAYKYFGAAEALLPTHSNKTGQVRPFLGRPFVTAGSPRKAAMNAPAGGLQAGAPKHTRWVLGGPRACWLHATIDFGEAFVGKRQRFAKIRHFASWPVAAFDPLRTQGRGHLVRAR